MRVRGCRWPVRADDTPEARLTPLRMALALPPGAPMAIRRPSTAVAMPKKALLWSVEGISFCFCPHLPSVCLKTKALPGSEKPE